jgi:hypothetical protein
MLVPAVLGVLQGMAAAMPRLLAPPQDINQLALQGKAAWCLNQLLHLLCWSFRKQDSSQLIPHATAAVQLASALMNGSGAANPGSCSCCLTSSRGGGRAAASAAPVLAFSRAGSKLPGCPGWACQSWRTAPLLYTLLGGLHKLQLLACGTVSVSAFMESPAARQLARSGGLLLQLQEVACLLTHVRWRQGQGGAGPPVPGCVDLAAFLGDGMDAAALQHLPSCLQHASVRLRAKSGCLNLALMAELAMVPSSPSSSPACPRCTPRHLLLLIDATSAFPGQALEQADPSCRVFSNVDLLFTASDRLEGAWVPGFVQQAVPTLAAWALAAAQQLPVSPADSSGAAGDASKRRALAREVLHAVRIITWLPGGVLLSPELHEDAPLQQLLACTERALRGFPDSAGDQAAFVMRLGQSILEVRASLMAASCRPGQPPVRGTLAAVPVP